MTLEPLWPVWAVALLIVPLGLAITLAVLRPARRIDWLRRTALFAVIAIAAVGPSVTEERAVTARTTVNVFFVVDLTGSMAAEDYADGQPRIEGATADVVAIAEAFPSARYSVLAWDSQATVRLPVTTDANAVTSWADTVRLELTGFSTGSQLDRPLDAVLAAMQSDAERNPEDVRLLYFLSDGENTDGEDSAANAILRSYNVVAPFVDGGAVLGYGTSEGGQMRSTAIGVDPADAPYILDESGQPAVSRIDQATLRSIASQLGVPYATRSAPGDIEPLVEGIDVETVVEDGRQIETVTRPVVWPLAIVALGLLGWELLALAGLLPGPRSEWDET